MPNRESERPGLGPERPFPGLRPYRLGDHPYFFGREEQTFALYRLLDRSRFTAVVGNSGSGKSSLVEAGLLPLLEEETKEGRARRWKWFEFRPGNTPLANLAEELAKSPPDRKNEPDLALRDIPSRMIEVLRRSSFGLREVLHEIEEIKDCSILIVVDQFEELFRYADPAESEPVDHLGRESRFNEAAAFVQLLLEASRDFARPIHVMLTMRSDYIGDCARFYELPEVVSAHQFLVPSLTRDQSEDAIRKPIEKAGATIDPELVQRLLNDLGTGNDRLPVLQHALMRMWDEAGLERTMPAEAAAARTPPDGRVRGRHLTLGLYQAIGTMSEALSRHANDVMKELGGLELVVEQTFRALGELDRENRAIRRPRRFKLLHAETDMDEADLRTVLDRFRREDCSFVRPPYPQPITNDTFVDIGHEALIRRWDRMGARPVGGNEQKGWLWAEAEDGNVYRGLLALAGDTASATLPLDQVESLWSWWRSRPRTKAWAGRYGGHLDRVQRLFKNSRRALQAERDRVEQQQHEQRAAEEAARRQEEERLRFEKERSQLEQDALRARLEEQTKLATERRRFTRLAAGAAVVFGVLAVAAGWGFWQARQQAIETTASKYWYRLQLRGDPLRSDDVATLWDLTGGKEEVRVAFVRQMTEDRGLLRRFGFRPQPIARAVGLRWPDKAREVVKQSLARIASDRFDPSNADLRELLPYSRAMAALQHLLDPATSDAAARNLASAINDLATNQQKLSDWQLWMLAETVGVFSESLQSAPIAPARNRLHREFTAAASGDGRDISRAIEAIAPHLDDLELRLQLVGYLAPRLGQDLDSWSATAVPQAASALLPGLDAGQADAIVRALPSAIAGAAGAQGDRDSSYLLSLMQLVETLAQMGDDVAARFGRALVAQFALPNDPLQLAALARATVPFLDRPGDDTALLNRMVAEITLVPEGLHLDPAHPAQRSLRRPNALRDATAAFEQAFVSLDDKPRKVEPEAALNLLHKDWSAQRPSARPNPYRRAAQLRLAALLAPSRPDRNPLAPDLRAALATDLLEMLPRAQDYLLREAIARALAALGPALPGPERARALREAQVALAKTGSTEEATAWAGAIAALLPDERGAATAEIVEALKYPTATEAPSVQLLSALAPVWGEQYKEIESKRLPDDAILNWLETRLPKGHSLTEPPEAPPGLQSEPAGPGRR